MDNKQDDYERTPSFYRDESYFNRYLGKTSYYLALQQVTAKLIQLTGSGNVLELGSALGTTSLLLGGMFPDVNFTGVDIREDVVEKANAGAETVPNVTFQTGDMCELVRDPLDAYDLIFMLYAFHHILDPLEKKEKFLRDCHENMRSGAYLLIAETFLPDGAEKDIPVEQLFRFRSNEGYGSTYWNSLMSLSEDALAFSGEVAESSAAEEKKAGEMVQKRDSEYLVEFGWLIDAAKKAGFEIVIAEPVNGIMDKAVLLRKK